MHHEVDENWLCLAASLLAMGTFALAAGPDDPATMSQDPNQWVIATGQLSARSGTAS